MRPRGSEKRFSGEALVANHVGEKPYISFAKGDSVGENLARAYGYSASNANSVQFNADDLLTVSRKERVMEALGGIERYIDEYAILLQKDGAPNDAGEYRKVAETEMRLLMENTLGYGSYVYNNDKTTKSIRELNDIENGTTTDAGEARKILYLNNIMKGKLDREIEAELLLLRRENEASPLGRQILTAIEKLSDLSNAYSELSFKERDELENQFPVVLLIEGKDLPDEGSGSLITQEIKCSSTISPDRIVEIRVPQRDADLVELWVEENRLKSKVIPLEIFEVQEVVQYEK